MSFEIINNLDRLVTQLKNNRDILGDYFCKEVTKSGKKFLEELSESVGESILHSLDDEQITKETLEAIITAVPSVLLVKNKYDLIPIQQACWYDASVEYIGLLAREGIKYNIGGEGKRGGLLLQDPTDDDNDNILQLLSELTDDDNPLEWDVLYRDALKDLWESGLLTADDIIENNLLQQTCYNQRHLRFEYLADICPEALKMVEDKNGYPLFHHIIQQDPKIECMPIFLRSALKHFPNELGLLFHQDNQGRSILEAAISKYGKYETFSIIRQCIPQDTTIPILHQVVKHAPHYISDFIFHYPDAMYLQNVQGDKRSYFQARVASGNTTFAKDVVFLASMGPDLIQSIDPVTDLYPFMVAASGKTSDLDTVFYLLKRDPKLAYEVPNHCGRRGNGKRMPKSKHHQGKGWKRQIQS